MNNIILASLSPRRRELLSQLGVPFRVESTNIEEIMDDRLPLDLRLEDLAYQKALPIARLHPHAIVIGADTIVCFHDQVLGKPKDYQDAKRMLLMFSGESQYVYTSITVLQGEKRVSFTSKTEVVFKILDEKQVEAYLAYNEWQDKAGAYAIQGAGDMLVDHYVGDFYTIVGLPVEQLHKVLKEEFDIEA
ncbi:MAG: Maf family protein [Beduini sp.]|uniref:Maf family protein n=1 Tax=Beduini sp. TaxID=1922300 RepID=UPI0011C77A03